MSALSLLQILIGMKALFRILPQISSPRKWNPQNCILADDFVLKTNENFWRNVIFIELFEI